MAEQGAAFTITADGKQLTLAHQNLPLSELRAVKVETGLSLDRHLQDIDNVTVCVLWWLARRANGEPRLPYLMAEAEFEKIETIDLAFGEQDENDPES